MGETIEQLLLLVLADLCQLSKHRITRNATEGAIHADRHQVGLPFGGFLKPEPETFVSRHGRDNTDDNLLMRRHYEPVMWNDDHGATSMSSDAMTYRTPPCTQKATFAIRPDNKQRLSRSQLNQHFRRVPRPQHGADLDCWMAAGDHRGGFAQQITTVVVALHHHRYNHRRRHRRRSDNIAHMHNHQLTALTVRFTGCP